MKKKILLIAGIVLLLTGIFLYQPIMQFLKSATGEVHEYQKYTHFGDAVNHKSIPQEEALGFIPLESYEEYHDEKGKTLTANATEVSTEMEVNSESKETTEIQSYNVEISGKNVASESIYRQYRLKYPPELSEEEEIALIEKHKDSNPEEFAKAMMRLPEFEIIESSTPESSFMPTIIPNKVSLQSPIEVGHSWNQPFEYNGQSLTATTTIKSITQFDFDYHQIEVETIVKGVKGYPKEYKEIAVYENRGLTSFESTQPLNRTNITFKIKAIHDSASTFAE